MPQVPRAVAKARAAQLRAAGEAQLDKLWRSRVGQIETVLVERDGLGRTEQFVPIAVQWAHGQVRIDCGAGHRPVRAAALSAKRIRTAA